MNTEEEFDVFYVDMNRLEEQVAEHSFLFVEISKDLKDARADAAQAKSDLDLAKADIGHRVTKYPQKYGLPEKINAAMIERVILKHPRQKKALAKLQRLQDRVNELQIYVAAFEHRKRMLSKAVELHSQQYFCKPYIATSEIREVVEQLERKEARQRAKVSKGKKRTGKKKKRG